jgi:hypothetical protein
VRIGDKYDQVSAYCEAMTKAKVKPSWTQNEILLLCGLAEDKEDLTGD